MAATIELDGKQAWAAHHEESAKSITPEPSSPSLNPKVDPHGFPLKPQPSDDPLDPLNWNKWMKLSVLLQVSFFAFLGPFSQGAINSAYRPLATYMHITVTEASYQTTLAIVMAGIAPLIWSPLANKYGRRPIYLLVSIIGIAAGAGCAVTTKWGLLLVARVFVGIGTSVGMGIGAASVSDMYFTHERGKYMGIYVVFCTNGAHVAAIVGGFTAKYVGWRACYVIPTVALGVAWLVAIFALPETLYHRDALTGASSGYTKSKRHLMGLRAPSATGNPTLWDFTHCFVMFKYPSVLLSGLYYSYAFGIGTVLFAVTGSAAFGGIYGFNTAQVGMAIGLSTTIGSAIGELASGPVSDWILYLQTRKNEGVSIPEARLQAMWPGFLILPIGVIIEGVCFQYKTHWIGPVLGIGIGAFGLQVVSTNTFAYLADCYKPQNAEISTVLNFGRLTFSFTLGFYMIPFAHETTYGIAWAVMALISVPLFMGVVALMWKGREWREKLGSPNFDRSL